MNAKKIAGTAIILAGIGIALSSPAEATGNSDKPPICHPVNGKGETGTGWDIISPDKASSHIDESKYPDGVYWKHESKDGRHDVYAVNGYCPTTPTETTSTTTVPSSTTSTTTIPSETTSSTTSSSSTTTATTPTETTSTTSTPSETTTTAVGTPSTTTTTKEVVKPKPVIKKPRTVTQPPAELAYTGPFNPVYSVVGLLLVLLGLIVTFGSTKIKVIRND